MIFEKIIIWAWAFTIGMVLFFILFTVIEVISDMTNMRHMKKASRTLLEQIAMPAVILFILSISMTFIFGIVGLTRKVISMVT